MNIDTGFPTPRGLTDTPGQVRKDLTAQRGVRTEAFLEGAGQPPDMGACAKAKTKVFAAIASNNRPQIAPAKHGVYWHATAAACTFWCTS